MTRRPPIVAVSGFSGSGKTRLLSRLIPALVRRGVRVGALKHTGHPHPFDVPGKDTDVLRRAGALAAAIEGPCGLAYFGPPAGGARALARLLPEVDLVLAEGFKHEALPRVEVYRPGASRAPLADEGAPVLAVVGARASRRRVPCFDPDDVEPLADLLCARFDLSRGEPRRAQRLRVRPTVSRLPAKGSERTRSLGRERMPKKTTNRKGATARARGGRRGGTSRSDAGRKGGNATLRARGPEFYSEIGRKGGKKSRSGTRGGRSAGAARTTTKRGTTTTKRGAARRGAARRTSRASR